MVQENLNEYKYFKFFYNLKNIYEGVKIKEKESKDSEIENQLEKETESVIKKLRNNFNEFKKVAKNDIKAYKDFWLKQNKALQIVKQKDPRVKLVYDLFNSDFLVAYLNDSGQFGIEVLKKNLNNGEDNPFFRVYNKKAAEEYRSFMNDMKNDIKAVKDHYINTVEKKKKEKEQQNKKEKLDKFLKESRFVKESMGDILRSKTDEEIIRDLSKLSKEEKNRKLIDASGDGHKDIVKMLLKAGVNVNVKDEYGETALIRASYKGHEDIVKILLKAGADVNAKTKGGSTALIRASYNGKDIVKVLLKAGADVNAKNEYGYTALMWASKYGYKDIVEILLKAGADVNAKNNDGDTALILASEYGYKDIVELLKKYRAK